jgi:putative ABC transport system permease protein
LFRRDRVERELDEELRYHLDRQVEEYVAKGMTADDARAAALRAMGGVELRKEECRDMRRVRLVDEARRDFRFGLRMLRRNPGFTAVAVLTLAIGIGANTAVFSVVDGVILRPLPFPEPDRIVRLWETNLSRGWNDFSASVPNFVDWRERSRSFEHLAALRSTSFNFTAGGDPERVPAAAITSDFLPTVGVAPALGRDFLPDEHRPGGDSHVVLVSHAFWKGRLGGDPSVVGTTITLNETGYTIAGVLPESFRQIRGADLVVPLAANPAEESRGNHYLYVLGRLAPGATVDQARAEMAALAAQMGEQYPTSNAGWGVRVDPLYDAIVSADTRRPLYLFLAAVALVLLIACINVASLMLARATTRQGEMAVRMALGAGRLRLAVQLLAEGLLIAAAAGALGLLLARWGVELLKTAADVNVPRLDQVSVDGRALAFTLAATLLTSLLFGIVPALHGSRSSLSDVFKGASRSTTAGAGRLFVRNVLVVAEIALSLMLLVGAGLLIRSFSTLRQVNPGFDPTNVVTMRVSLPPTKYEGDDEVRTFFEELLAGVTALPDVEDAGVVNAVPFGGGNTAIEVVVDGQPPAADGSLPSANWRMVTPGYFRALRVPLLRGRDFTESEYRQKVATAIISDEMARRYWPGQDPIGKRFFWHSLDGPELSVVGVVGDVYSSGLDVKPRPTIYLPSMLGTMTLVVRTGSEPTAQVAAVRSIVNRLDPTLPISDVARMDQSVADSTGTQRFTMVVFGCFAAAALLLAAVGLYGVLAYSVLQRTHEFGIRMALGAEARNVLGLVVRHGMGLALVGLALGTAGALAFGRLMNSLLFEVEPTDPATYAGVVSLLAVVVLLACWLPARRAVRVDPMKVLRQD